jgi:hypothetical protein
MKITGCIRIRDLEPVIFVDELLPGVVVGAIVTDAQGLRWKVATLDVYPPRRGIKAAAGLTLTAYPAPSPPAIGTALALESAAEALGGAP